MIGLTNYLNFAKAQNKKLIRVEGIMIYYPEFGSLPQDVLFAPVVWDRKGDFKHFLINEFAKEDFVIYQTYFQGMRWILPDLEERLASTKKNVIKAGNNYNEAWVTYVAITFDVTGIKNSEDSIMLSRDKLLQIIIRDYKTAIRLQDLPDEMGTGKLFEPIFW